MKGSHHNRKKINEIESCNTYDLEGLLQSGLIANTDLTVPSLHTVSSHT